MVPFKIEITHRNTLPVVHIAGELDIHNCKELDSVLSPLLSASTQTLAFNLAQTVYIDSTGLGILAHAARHLAKTQGSVLVICPKPQLKKVFELAGLHKKNVLLFEDETTALSNY